MKALDALAWPRSKLDIKLVCEDDDHDTIAALQACADELLTHWELDAAAHQQMSRPAYPDGGTAGWIRLAVGAALLLALQAGSAEAAQITRQPADQRPRRGGPPARRWRPPTRR